MSRHPSAPFDYAHYQTLSAAEQIRFVEDAAARGRALRANAPDDIYIAMREQVRRGGQAIRRAITPATIRNHS